LSAEFVALCIGLLVHGRFMQQAAAAGAAGRAHWRAAVHRTLLCVLRQQLWQRQQEDVHSEPALRALHSCSLQQ
jgi:hypothetical protein